VFFLIGLSAVWEESNLTGTIIITIILAVIAGVWGWLSWFIRRREKRNHDAADAFAGPRLYWIDHPERLQHSADGPVGGEGWGRHPAGSCIDHLRGCTGAPCRALDLGIG